MVKTLLPSQNLYCGGMTTIVVPTLWWHDYHHVTYTVVKWLPLLYLHYANMTTNMVPTMWWHDYNCATYTMVTWQPADQHCGDMLIRLGFTLWWHDLSWYLHVVTLQPSSILWWHDYQHQTNTVVTWLLEGDVHCGDMTTIMVPTLWNLYCGSTTSNMRFTLKWPDCCQRIYTVMTWRPPTYPLSGDWNSIMLPPFWWHDLYHGTYTAMNALPFWYLHYGDMTTIRVPTL